MEIDDGGNVLMINPYVNCPRITSGGDNTHSEVCREGNVLKKLVLTCFLMLSCSPCSGHGQVMCPTCRTYGSLQWYIKLTVTWYVTTVCIY